MPEKSSNHDLPLLMDLCEEVRDLSMQYRLKRSQARAFAEIIKDMRSNLV